MSAPNDCSCTCTTPVVVEVPGVEGEPGTNGMDGVNAFTTTTSGSTVPAAAGDQVTLAVADTSWMVVGQVVVVGGPSNYRVTSIGGATAVTLTWLDYPNDVAGGTAIANGAKVSPGGELSPGVAGAGSPEGVLSASPGMTYLNTTDSSFWSKLTGTGNTGWIKLIGCIVFLGLCANLLAQPILRQSLTTNTEAAVRLVVSNIVFGIVTNNPGVLTYLSNLSYSVTTNDGGVQTYLTNLASTISTNQASSNRSVFIVTNVAGTFQTNYQLTFTNTGGTITTNTLYWTNGILKKITSP